MIDPKVEEDKTIWDWLWFSVRVKRMFFVSVASFLVFGAAKQPLLHHQTLPSHSENQNGHIIRISSMRIFLEEFLTFL